MTKVENLFSDDVAKTEEKRRWNSNRPAKVTKKMKFVSKKIGTVIHIG